jgi:hypothetical protein
MKNFRSLSILGAALIVCAALALCTAPSLTDAASLLGSLLLFGLGTGFLVGDAVLAVTRALPAAASATVNSTGIDLEVGTRSDFVAYSELLVSAPALSTTILPDTRTMTYHVQHDTDPAFGTAVTIANSLIVQTGAGGVPALPPPRPSFAADERQALHPPARSSAGQHDRRLATSATMQLMT